MMLVDTFKLLDMDILTTPFRRICLRCVQVTLAAANLAWMEALVAAGNSMLKFGSFIAGYKRYLSFKKISC